MNKTTLAVKSRTKSRTAAAVLLVGAISLGSAPQAFADPEQGGTTPDNGQSQEGTAPDSGDDVQGGTVPTAPPAPSPAPPGPGIVPGPPPGQWEEQPTPSPSYPDVYSPAPQGPLHAPRWVPPVKRKKPEPQTLRVGNLVVPEKDLPNIPEKKRVLNSVNAYSAYYEAEIARGLISIGVPPDEASRKAAATVFGAAAGGVTLGSASFLTTTVVVGVVAIPVGALIGAGVGAGISGGNPVATLGGAGLGAAGGAGVALGAGTAAGILGFGLGALGGGALGYLLGAGDPGAHPERPTPPWENNLPRETEPGIVAFSDDNQFELHVSPEAAKKSGLPAVSYVVNQRGDVAAAARIGGQTVEVSWTAEQAQAPIHALGSAAPAAEKAINDGVRAVTDVAARALPELEVMWPQQKSHGKHAK